MQTIVENKIKSLDPLEAVTYSKRDSNESQTIVLQI